MSTPKTVKVGDTKRPFADAVDQAMRGHVGAIAALEAAGYTPGGAAIPKPATKATKADDE